MYVRKRVSLEQFQASNSTYPSACGTYSCLAFRSRLCTHFSQFGHIKYRIV